MSAVYKFPNESEPLLTLTFIEAGSDAAAVPSEAADIASAVSTLAPKLNLFLLSMHRLKDNSFSRFFCQTIISALDKVEQLLSEREIDENAALITTGISKFYSNGLDLNEFGFIEELLMDNYMPMLAKLITFRIPTIAAINGHAFAGGCMFAFAHDYRVMRSDVGYICMNEIELRAPLTPGMLEVIRCKVPDPNLFREIILQGVRIKGEDALKHGIVDYCVKGDEVMKTAITLAGKKGVKAPRNLTYLRLKREMYVDAYNKLMSRDLGFVSPNAKL
ncbi:ClpP/crotonase [Ramicandelaber brevisporus]|nr:ClpP/crotonase [Ramicandelaber brevisporus]